MEIHDIVALLVSLKIWFKIPSISYFPLTRYPSLLVYALYLEGIFLNSLQFLISKSFRIVVFWMIVISYEATRPKSGQFNGAKWMRYRKLKIYLRAPEIKTSRLESMFFVVKGKEFSKISSRFFTAFVYFIFYAVSDDRLIWRIRYISVLTTEIFLHEVPCALWNHYCIHGALIYYGATYTFWVRLCADFLSTFIKSALDTVDRNGLKHLIRKLRYRIWENSDKT